MKFVLTVVVEKFSSPGRRLLDKFGVAQQIKQACWRSLLRIL